MILLISNSSKNPYNVFKCPHNLSLLLQISYLTEPTGLLLTLVSLTSTLLEMVLTKEKQLLPFSGESITIRLFHTSPHTFLVIPFLPPGKLVLYIPLPITLTPLSLYLPTWIIHYGLPNLKLNLKKSPTLPPLSTLWLIFKSILINLSSLQNKAPPIFHFLTLVFNLFLPTNHLNF